MTWEQVRPHFLAGHDVPCWIPHRKMSSLVVAEEKDFFGDDVLVMYSGDQVSVCDYQAPLGWVM